MINVDDFCAKPKVRFVVLRAIAQAHYCVLLAGQKPSCYRLKSGHKTMRSRFAPYTYWRLHHGKSVCPACARIYLGQ